MTGTVLGSGNAKKKTFFVDYPEPTGEDLVFLSFGKDRVVVNTGRLKDDKIKIYMYMFLSNVQNQLFEVDKHTM